MSVTDPRLRHPATVPSKLLKAKRMTVSIARTQSLDAYDKLVARQKRAQLRAQKLRERAHAHALNHLKAFLLSSFTEAKLVAHVRNGGELCCADGLKYLRGVVDPLWAEVLNGWAYERLGCKGVAEEDRARYVAKLKIAFEDDSIIKYWETNS